MNICLELGLNAMCPRGADAYFHGLVKGLIKGDSKNRYTLFSYFFKDYKKKLDAMPYPLSNRFEVKYKRWPERLIRWAEKKGLIPTDHFVNWNNFDIYHNLGGRMPDVTSCLNIVTIYDLIPEVFKEMGVECRKPDPELKQAALRAKHIIAISQATKNDLIRFYGIPESKITVVHLGVDKDIFSPSSTLSEENEAFKRKYALPDKYILFMGPFEKKRNHESGLEAMCKMRYWNRGIHAVFIGDRNGYAESLQIFGSLRGMSPWMHFPGFVPKEDLPFFYRNALMLCHPELYDGFSLQLVEAMSCGTPVIGSNRGALPEVIGDAGPIVNPNSSEDISEAMMRVLSDMNYYRKAVLKQSEKFSLEKMAEDTIAVYDHLTSFKEVARA